jgi:chemotaxis protein histidine kinase CheA/CheY-like chemotaxis protein
MQLADLLAVLRDEFETAAADIDDRLVAWMGDEPAQAPVHCEGLVDTLNRLATVVRLVGLEGQGQAFDWLRDAAQLFALSDDASMADGLGWLMLWREPLATAIQNPGSEESAQIVVEYLSAGPMPLDAAHGAHLLQLLRRAPQLDEESVAEHAAQFAPPSLDDVALDVPADADPALVEQFLHDAPGQLARLAEAVEALRRGAVPAEQLEAAQRLAHTFKGSGNIIGIRGVARLAHRIEDLIEFAQGQEGRLPAPIAADLSVATATLDQMVYALRGEESPPEPALALAQLGRLVDWVRAIDDGEWEARLSEQAPFAEPAREPDVAPSGAAAKSAPVLAVAGRSAAPERTAALPAAETEAQAQIRLPANRLDALVRRAGQALVRHSRVAERLQQAEQRLEAAAASQALLTERLRMLELQIERQGVTLSERAQAAGFDALEMDRYSELHTLSRFVAEAAADSLELVNQARDAQRQTLQDLPEHERGLRASHRELMQARLLPFSHIAARLRRNVLQTAHATGKSAQLQLEGEAVMLDSDVLERLTDPLLHLLRNAVDHGLESPDERALLGKPTEGTVTLSVRGDGPMVEISVRDDGRGLDHDAILRKAQSLGLVAAGQARPDNAQLARLILLPGFSTREQVSDISGRGVGLDVVAQRLRALKGELDIHSEPLAGTRFQLRLPSSLGSGVALVVEAAGERFALPAEGVRMGVAASMGTRVGDELQVEQQRWPSDALAARLGLSEDEAIDREARAAVVLHSGSQERALRVDRVLESRELILQEPGQLLRRLPAVAGAALRADGRVMFLLDPAHLVQPAAQLDEAARGQLRRRQQQQRRRLLVVDDSLSVRKGLTQLLADAGYAVRGARDGFEALQMLDAEPSELVLTDLEMPNLNGLELTRALRADTRWASLPVIMLTSRATDKHRASAREAGVNGYLTKPYTDEALLGEVRGLMMGA